MFNSSVEMGKYFPSWFQYYFSKIKPDVHFFSGEAAQSSVEMGK